MRVHMTGAQWPSATAGGLARYFEDLFAALRGRSDLAVSATAFGRPPDGGGSWGPDEGPLRRRVRASRVAPPAGTAVLDRHFALYGPPARSAALVTHFHGPWAQESAIAGESRVAVAVKQLVERMRYRDSDRIVVLSTAFRDVLIGNYDVDSDRVVVIPPGVDLDRFSPAPRPTQAPPRVLCVRRLERRMGIDVLITAWRAVRTHCGDARLDIVGTGSQRGELVGLTNDLGLAGSVSFVGAVDDAELARRYAEADISVVPSRAWEGFGLVVLESLASGCAPIVTRVGGLPDAVRDLRPDLVVPAEDPEALAERICAALAGARPTPQQCRAHAERFSWHTAAQRHADLYQALAS